jgi:hypothetical protein
MIEDEWPLREMAAAVFARSHAFHLTRVAQPGLFAAAQRTRFNPMLMSVLGQPPVTVGSGHLESAPPLGVMVVCDSNAGIRE